MGEKREGAGARPSEAARPRGAETHEASEVEQGRGEPTPARVTVAALFVATGGCYFGLPDVDPWDQPRDARRYAGPCPVVAHPPCERWGRYWHGGPSARVRRTKGDDGGCFAAALASVRRWGGVLEHPADSAAWAAFGLKAPQRGGWWEVADWLGGWTCCVEQGNYGHRAGKPTWLYASGISRLPSLRWGRSERRARIDGYSFRTHEERARWKAGEALEPARARMSVLERMGKRERAATPIEFRDQLLAIARAVSR